MQVATIANYEYGFYWYFYQVPPAAPGLAVVIILCCDHTKLTQRLLVVITAMAVVTYSKLSF